MLNWSQSLYLWINGFAGRWPLLDEIQALVLNNDLMKGGVVGACVIAAWYWGRSAEMQLASRRTVLAIFIGCIAVIATTKTISRMTHFPRPYVLSQETFILDHAQLRSIETLPFKVPLDAKSQDRFADLRAGTIDANDLESFPSDHAGFFIFVSLGLFFVSRWLGVISLAWVTVFVLGSKVMSGQHAPLDIAGGALIAVVWALLVFSWSQSLGRRLLDRTVQASFAYPSLASVVVFLLTFEVSATFGNTHQLLSAGKQMFKLWRSSHAL